ncbi:hypothetical protein NCCP2716_18640 [Sporosarcina sp. NCCP-2716]|nr:hypothetical protein NCCP2716_18640 [Sporosarcina sp. NCCP-2716]
MAPMNAAAIARNNMSFLPVFLIFSFSHPYYNTAAGRKHSANQFFYGFTERLLSHYP